MSSGTSFLELKKGKEFSQIKLKTSTRKKKKKKKKAIEIKK